MPVLRNPKHERYAQSMAAGKTATEAMADAGYADPRNSTRLTKNEEIRSRIDELQEKAAEKALISRQWVIERLVTNVDRAMQVEEIKDNKGLGTGEFKYEGAVANKALELLGKDIGMFKERIEHSGTVTLADLVGASMAAPKEGK